MKNLLRSICDPTIRDRDLFVDELNDLIENGEVNKNDQSYIANALLKLIDHGSDSALCESIFNLIGTVFANGVAVDIITNETIKHLHALSPGCLAHAILIIANSNSQNKKELLAPFTESKNTAIRKITEDALKNF